MPLSRQIPPFRADHVGSLLRPPNLLDARERFRRGELSAVELKGKEDVAIAGAIAMQEELGLQSITDGEFRRTLWHADFLLSFDNVVSVKTGAKAKFKTAEGEMERPLSAFNIAGKLKRSKPIFVDHFKYVKSLTTKTAKQTIPSPSILHFRAGRSGVDAKAYPDMGEFYADLSRVYAEEINDLAAAGCRYLQIDETNFAYLCDPAMREQAQNIGEDPDKLPMTYAKIINDALAGAPQDMVSAIHLCRGNFEGAWVAEGGYEPVAETLFNAINVHGYFLEYDSERAGDFKPLRFVPKGKTVVLGLVTTKSGRLESKDALKRQIEAASKFCPLDQLALSPQCGFASGERGNQLTLDDEKAKIKLVVDVARDVWG
ncbi:5-methyltetrahydropteroyltriglutamate--homocysteine S-methyltransferase [Roseiarcaceae bacterium H3SJ34-1]|uniref:5-methyltetrahydropteroyltriglutamate-- homocysteine S-methyltransferase n=1 Tax=Terripilifer ovatus TaxID=3032367 RepID=UPI003AB91A8B|nr:5-methyltetrahydropteroyltriglutamate--homocysteine S-methyltransferase [Roseiarcaceae bacterium H3SJ34-1]